MKLFQIQLEKYFSFSLLALPVEQMTHLLRHVDFLLIDQHC